jgi:hypothetical protein
VAVKNSSRRPVSKTDERVQKFEFLELFFYIPAKLHWVGKIAATTLETMPSVVSEKAQLASGGDSRKGTFGLKRKACRSTRILNDCSMPEPFATSLQAPGTWARENRIIASDRRDAAAISTFGLDTA